MDRAVSGAASRPDLRSKAALLARKRQGLPAVNKAMRRAVDRDQAVDFLAIRLPDYALAAAVGYTIERIHQDPDRALALLREKGKAKDWNPKAVRSAGVSIDALFRDLELQGIDHAGRPQASDVSWHLKEFRDRRRAEMAAQNAAYENGTLPIQVSPHPAAPRIGKKPGQQGVYSGTGRLRALKWAQKHAGVDLSMQDVFLDTPLALHRSEAIPAIPISVLMLCMLELFCVNPAMPLVMRVYAAGILICCYACLRFAQAQDCYFSEIHQQAMFSGFVYREKNAKPSKRVTRPFWGSLHWTSRQNMGRL